MKKQLLSTSAIALTVAAAAPASAQDWNLDWGGFMSAHVAFADVSDSTGAVNDYDGLVMFNTGEIIFSPSVTLDNGLTFGVNVQFEAQNQGDNNTTAATNGTSTDIDESYIQISGDSLGTIKIGGENSAGYTMSYGAPTVTSMYINSPSISAFIPLSNAVPFGFRQYGISSYAEVAGNNDIQRITYITPDFNGFSAGISYARNNNGNAPGSFAGSAVLNNTTSASMEDIFDVALAYAGSFGSTDIGLSARYGTANATAVGVSDPDVWGLGFSVGFGAITVGGSYGENDNSNGAFGLDNSGWSLGATYDAAGPWAFELVTYQGEYDNVLGNDEYSAYKLGASRDVGPGVDWDIYLVFAEADATTNGGGDVDGTVLGTAINLSF